MYFFTRKSFFTNSKTELGHSLGVDPAGKNLTKIVLFEFIGPKSDFFRNSYPRESPAYKFDGTSLADLHIVGGHVEGPGHLPSQPVIDWPERSQGEGRGGQGSSSPWPLEQGTQGGGQGALAWRRGELGRARYGQS